MNPWIVLSGLAVIVFVFVVVPIGFPTFTRWRRPVRLTCPRAGREAQLSVGATHAAVAAVLGRGAPHVERCSLWAAVRECREECLALPDESMRTVPRGTPPPAESGLRRILVPLDGAPGSETVLDTVGELARRYRATVRLVHVAAPAEGIRSDDGMQVVAYVDQEGEHLEVLARAYFKDVARRLPGVTIEEAVRFGDPVEQIVAEAEAAGAELIAMSTHHRTPLGRLVHRSFARRLQHTTTIPMLLVPYGERTAA